MTTMTLQIENSSIIPSLRKVLAAIDGVTISKCTRNTKEKTSSLEIPNAATLSAMQEIESGHDAGEVKIDSIDNFMASML